MRCIKEDRPVEPMMNMKRNGPIFCKFGYIEVVDCQRSLQDSPRFGLQWASVDALPEWLCRKHLHLYTHSTRMVYNQRTVITVYRSIIRQVRLLPTEYLR